MLTKNEIFTRLSMFIANEIELQELEEWIVLCTLDRLLDCNDELKELIGSVELSLYEFSSGYSSINEVRREFQNLLPQNPAQIFGSLARYPHPIVQTSTFNHSYIQLQSVS